MLEKNEWMMDEKVQNPGHFADGMETLKRDMKSFKLKMKQMEDYITFINGPAGSNTDKLGMGNQIESQFKSWMTGKEAAHEKLDNNIVNGMERLKRNIAYFRGKLELMERTTLPDDRNAGREIGGENGIAKPSHHKSNHFSEHGKMKHLEDYMRFINGIAWSEESAKETMSRSTVKMPTNFGEITQGKLGDVDHLVNGMESLIRDMNKLYLSLLQWVYLVRITVFAEFLGVKLTKRTGDTGAPRSLDMKAEIIPDKGRELILYFLSNPTAQNIRIGRLDNVEFPAITVCPLATWNQTALQNRNLNSGYMTNWILGKGWVLNSWILNWLNMSIDETLNMFTLNDFSLLEDCSIGLNIGEADCLYGNRSGIDGHRVVDTYGGSWRESRFLQHDLFPFMKTCYTFDAKLLMEMGRNAFVLRLFLSFSDFEYTSNTYEIHVHSKGEPFTDGMPNVPTTQQTLLVTKGRSYEASLYPRKLLSLPSGQACNGDENYDFNQCVEGALKEKFLDEAPCAPPSLVPLGVSSLKPPCNTTDDFGLFLDFYDSVKNNFTPGCLRKCNTTVYDAIIVPDGFGELGNLPLTRIDFLTPTKEVGTLEDQVLKTLPQFLSDIGGMVGLYLDFSLLSLYVLLETLIIHVISRFSNPQVRPVSRPG
ncbi:unnamed protein product [Darwinula stevensoni]|uniref:Uncharacterized protein n=1 Tax=Darwinula stevensoni TaxID=69355 RepID=A0A7R9AEN1_9CRUS|nr:unnamed protein product [Darwinula stevensoni]CAG0901770.1 unnamed protein product [Darwinula stevensoni]